METLGHHHIVIVEESGCNADVISRAQVGAKEGRWPWKPMGAITSSKARDATGT